MHKSSLIAVSLSVSNGDSPPIFAPPDPRVPSSLNSYYLVCGLAVPVLVEFRDEFWRDFGEEGLGDDVVNIALFALEDRLTTTPPSEIRISGHRVS